MKKKIFLTFLVGLFGFVGINDVNAVTYKKYEDGTAVYYNPVEGKKCTDYTELNSMTGEKTGCMKFYTFNDSENSTTVDMILDHNTTVVVAWNSSGKNVDGMKEVRIALESDTTGWKETARLITSDEIAKITGADYALKWSSRKQYRDYIDTTEDLYKYISSFYLDGTGTTYSSTDGWKKKVATSKGSSKYAWLFDYTKDCKSSGCNFEDWFGTRGYWTSSIGYSDEPTAWVVGLGIMYLESVDDRNNYGVRPVITISKSLLDVDNSNTSTDNNENNSNTNTSTDNNENNSNTNTSTGNNENNSNTNTSTGNNENNSNTNTSIDNNENNSNLDTTTEKNPQTGIKKIGISVILIGLISFLVYIIVRNKKVFTK